jgi:hypothetical protein
MSIGIRRRAIEASLHGKRDPCRLLKDLIFFEITGEIPGA